MAVTMGDRGEEKINEINLKCTIMNQGQKFVFGKKAKNKQTQGTEL